MRQQDGGRLGFSVMAAAVAASMMLMAAGPALAQRQVVVERAGRASWDQLVQAELARPEGPELRNRVVHPPTKLGEAGEIVEIGPPDVVAPEPARDEAAAEGAACSTGLADLTLQENFQALSDNNTAIPPDTMGAAGPNHVMTMLNTEVGIQLRDGGQLSRVSLETFWTSGTGLSGNTFDPRLLYDSLSGRWIATVDANSRSSQSSVFFAISDTDDPTGMWSFFQIEADVDDVNWADFPGFGVNSTWIAITNNMFSVSNNFFAGVKMWVIDKSTALAGGPLTVTVFDPGFDEAGGFTSFTMKPCQTFDADEPDLFIVSQPGLTASGIPVLRFSRISGTAAAPAWSALPGQFGGANAGSGLYVVGDDFSFGLIDADQPGTSTDVATNSVRILNSVCRNGRVWATHIGGLPASGTVDRTAAFWHQFDPSGSGAFVQSGVIDGGPGTHHFFPSVSVNCANDACIGFSRSDAGRFVEGAFAGRLGGDALGATRQTVVIKPGEDSYVKTFGSGTVRWGDYSATVVDPVDDLSFWTIQQYAETDVGPNGNDDRWGTWWARIGPAAGCQGDLNADGLVDGADLGLLLLAWGPCDGPCPGNFNGDIMVDGADLGLLLLAWGPCSGGG